MSDTASASVELATCFEQGLALLESQAWAPALERFSCGLQIDPHRPGLWHNRAWCHIHLGDLPAAQADLEALVRLQPGHAQGLALLGRVRLAQGAVEEGSAWLDRAWMADPHDVAIARQALQALLLHPGDASAVVQRAKALARAGQLDRDSAHRLHEVLGASAAGRQALREMWAQLCTETQAPTWMFEAWTGLCWQARQVDEATLAATLWLQREPGSDTALRALMRALAARGDSDTLMPLAAQRAQAHPRDIEAMLELAGGLLEAPGDARRDAGLTVLAHALSLDPEDPRPWLQRAHHHAKVFMHEAALSDFRRVLALQPPMWSARAGLARSLAALGRHDEAAQALQAMPLHDAPSQMEQLTARAFVLRTQGRLGEAETVLRDALAVGKSDRSGATGTAAQWELGCVRLTQGRYEEGWALWRGLQQERGPRPLWHRLVACGARPWGGDVSQVRGRTLAVVSETGLGDALQFARFLPALQAQGVRVVLCVQRALVPLLRLTQPPLAVVDDVEAMPPADGVCALWDLPMLLDVRLEALDRWGPARYLHPARPACDAMTQRLGPPSGLRVALAWRGMRSPLAERSIALEHFAELNVQGVQWFSLQQDLMPGPETEAAERMGLRHESWSLEEAAQALGAMDLVVSVDTVFCHLAGSLGLPAQVLLPLACDWRWGQNAPTTPWYPRATLWRQQQPGDWSAPLAALAGLLRQRVVERSVERSAESMTESTIERGAERGAGVGAAQPGAKAVKGARA